ncbi:MAG: CopG family ribbon-helix-helix protein [Azonexus sp.]|nr:CopG family ribbon-helix-helix protein [Azonexus sp.]MDZ4317121.1 CopG family ribbon-helix-helix protein [Azonexus sp.]
MHATTTRPVAVKLDSTTRERMKKLADAKHRTPHWLMREAIEQYVDREEKRESFRQDGLRAWDAYQATGLHVTHAEADTWLEQLEAGNDVEPPKCHD